MRFRAPVVALLVAALALAVAAWVTGRDGASHVGSADATRAATTPVLSARRVPELLLAAQRDPVLAKSLDAIVAAGPAATCLSVQIAGRDVYGHNASLPVPPASNEKLLTAQLALQVLGPDYRYTTKVVGPRRSTTRSQATSSSSAGVTRSWRPSRTSRTSTTPRRSARRWSTSQMRSSPRGCAT